jgi:FkbM family methyltransferase
LFKITLYILNIFDKIYQKKIIKKFKEIFSNNINTIFDVGSHKGEFINLMLNNFITHKIYSFEPSEKNYKILKKNINNLNLKTGQIYLNNFALGEANEKRKFKQMAESSSSTLSNIDTNSKYFKRKNFFLNFGFKSKIFDEITIEIKNGSSFIEMEKIDKIDLLKIDTEGHEYFVLKGFGDNLKKIKTIFFEHHYDQMIVKDYTFSNIHDYLILKGFKPYFKFKMPLRKSFEYIYINKN